MPPAGRYNAGQKLLFWGFFVFGLLLLLSGLVLWFPEYIPWSLRFLRYTAIIVHVGSALITIGLFMLHVYMGVFAERGAFGSVIRGDVSAARVSLDCDSPRGTTKATAAMANHPKRRALRTSGRTKAPSALVLVLH